MRAEAGCARRLIQAGPSGGGIGRDRLENIEDSQSFISRGEILEASPGIEPGYKDLQSSASPLRHEASHAHDLSRGERLE